MEFKGVGGGGVQPKNLPGGGIFSATKQQHNWCLPCWLYVIPNRNVQSAHHVYKYFNITDSQILQQSYWQSLSTFMTYREHSKSA